MAWCPFAKKMELQPESDQQQAIRPTQLIVHSIVAPWTPERTYEYWRDSTNLESHFGVGYDGSTAQYIGTETRADANAGANRRPDGTGAVSVETASNTTATDAWTDAQIDAIARIAVWLHERHGMPLKVCTSHSAPGIGYHRMFPQWSTDGTACPGPARVRQFTEVLMPRILQLASGQSEKDDDMPSYVNLGLAKPYQLRPNGWDAIEFTTEWTDELNHHPDDNSVFVRGPARFTGTLSLGFDDLPVGEVVQVRAYEAEGADITAYHPLDEVVGNPGGTAHVMPITQRVRKNRSMRVRLNNLSGQTITVSKAVLSALVWKE